MYCKECGKLLGTDDKFCSKCGTRVEEGKMRSCLPLSRPMHRQRKQKK